MESGDKMTAEERRKWTSTLMDKVMTIHEQGKHYVHMEIANYEEGELLSVYVMENGFEENKKYNLSKTCLTDFEPEELYQVADYLDSLIEDGEESK